MKNYIGVKLIKAEPMTKEAFEYTFKSKKQGVTITHGYHVQYNNPDGSVYDSWSPKDVFEKAYFPLEKDNSITEGDVNNFLGKIESENYQNRTTLVFAKDKTGFQYFENSTCVHKKNYDKTIGESICIGKVKDKIWEKLGFVLKWAIDGLD